MPHNGQLNLCQVIVGHLAQAVLSFNAAQIVGTHLTRCLHIVPFWHYCLQLAMESQETRCNSNEVKFLKWLTAQDKSLEHPLFWCQALHVLHSSLHLTGFCMSTYCEFTPMQGLQVLPCCLHAFVGIAANLQIYLTTFSAQSLLFLPSHMQAQADADPSGLATLWYEQSSSRCLLCPLLQDSSCKDGICIHCLSARAACHEDSCACTCLTHDHCICFL